MMPVLPSWSGPALLTANVFLSSSVEAWARGVVYALMGTRLLHVRPLRMSCSDGVSQRWKLMPKPLPLLSPEYGGASSTIAYALPSSSNCVQTSDVVYSSPRSPRPRLSVASSGPVPPRRGSSAG